MANAPQARLGRLSGKSAVITGAAKGIGRVTAIRFAAEGARLTVTDVDRSALEELGDALVADGTKVVTVTGDDWDQVMAIDGRRMFLTCKYAIEHMVTVGGGSIVCLSSISGLAGQAGQSTYGPAKFVASGLTKHLAVEWADEGIG